MAKVNFKVKKRDGVRRMPLLMYKGLLAKVLCVFHATRRTWLLGQPKHTAAMTYHLGQAKMNRQGRTTQRRPRFVVSTSSRRLSLDRHIRLA